MKSRTTKQFWKLFDALPRDIQKRATKAYEIFSENPQHPSLRFKRIRIDPPYYSARINDQYRAVGVLRGDTIIWFWIGKHDPYDRLSG